MTGVDDLLAAVLADPWDDLHRLRYADWLEDRGLPGDAERAEFIRVQVELAGLSAGSRREMWCDWGAGTDCGECTRCRLTKREQALLERCHEWGLLPKLSPAYEGDRLLPHFYPGHGRTWYPCEFARGFIVAVQMPLSMYLGGACGRCNTRRTPTGEWLARLKCPHCGGPTTPGLAAEMFRRHPITAVRVTDVDPYESADGLWYYDDRHGADLYALPDEVFDQLGGEYAESAGTGFRSCGFRSSPEAADRLSVVLVGIGRERAGLPPPKSAIRGRP